MSVLVTYIVNSYALICIFYPDSSAYVYNFVSLRNYLGVCIYKVVVFWGFLKFNYAHIFHSASLSKCLFSVPVFLLNKHLWIEMHYCLSVIDRKQSFQAMQTFH